MRDYKLYLKDILSAIDSIERFTAGMDAAYANPATGGTPVVISQLRQKY